MVGYTVKLYINPKLCLSRGRPKKKHVENKDKQGEPISLSEYIVFVDDRKSYDTSDHHIWRLLQHAETKNVAMLSPEELKEDSQKYSGICKLDGCIDTRAEIKAGYPAGLYMSETEGKKQQQFILKRAGKGYPRNAFTIQPVLKERETSNFTETEVKQGTKATKDVLCLDIKSINVPKLHYYPITNPPTLNQIWIIEKHTKTPARTM
jgi:hypothetical protein